MFLILSSEIINTQKTADEHRFDFLELFLLGWLCQFKILIKVDLWFIGLEINLIIGPGLGC